MLRFVFIYVLLIVSATAFTQAKFSTPGELALSIQKTAPDTNRINLLLDLGNYYLDKSDASKNRLDSAMFYFKQAQRLSDSLHAENFLNKTLVQIGNCYIDDGDLKTGKASIMQAIGYFRKTGNKEQEAFAWYKLGDRIPINPKENIPDKIQSFEHARALFKETNHPLEEIESNKGIAYAHLREEKLDQAEKELLLVLDQYKAAGYKKLHYTYDLLAEVSKLKVDLHKEILYRMELIKSMEETADTAQADYYYAKLALVYADLDMHDQSLIYIMKSMDILKRRAKWGDYYGYLSLAIYDFISKGKPEEALVYLKKTEREVPPVNLAQKVDLYEMFGNCYTAMKQYDKAEQYYLEMLQAYKITNFNKTFYTTNDQMVTDHIHYYETMGGFYLLTKQYQKAGYYLTNILALPEGTIRPITLSKFHQMQFVVDSASGNYVSAIRHLEIHKKLNDSLFNATKSKQVSELQIKYETEQKEQSIKLLESQSKSQQAEIQKVNLEKNLIIGGLAMLLVIMGLAYNGYRNKQRSNKKLQLQQEEINQKNLSLQSLLKDKDQLLKEKDWLLKEVHHRVKNNLQIVISLLNAQTDFLEDPSALHAISESRERMQAIALIHQKLYQPDNSTLIDMRSYIQEMVNHLGSSFGNTGKTFFQLDIHEIALDVSQAVPLGLILNEAITNAVKYAFPSNQYGKIDVLLHKINAQDILLKIADNGKGLPENFSFEDNDSLGIQLMKLFAEQLEGDLEFRGENGVEISLVFKQVFLTETMPSFSHTQEPDGKNINR